MLSGCVASVVSGDDVERRALLVKALPYLVAAYWEAGTQLTPSSLLTRILETYENLREDIASERDNLQSMLSDLNDLKINFEDGKLSFDLDRQTALDLIAAYLKKSFAKDGGTTAISKTFAAELAELQHYDAELKLPDRSIYARLLFRELRNDELSTFREEAQRRPASEYWLFCLKGKEFDIRLEPVFVSENKVMFGRVRCLSFSRILDEMLEKSYQVSATQKGDGVEIILAR